jgi:hypothetical protein
MTDEPEPTPTADEVELTPDELAALLDPPTDDAPGRAAAGGS